MTTLVSVTDIWKIYGAGTAREVNALQGVDFQVHEGRAVAIGGPSGSGKTTLLSIIGLLTRPTKGRVILDGYDYTTISEVFCTKKRRNDYGFIFQAQYLLSHLTAIENVSLPMLCMDVSRNEAEDMARDILISLGLEKRIDFRVAELSGGEQQRVSIARALMNKPRLLIADEPSSSIDKELTTDLLRILRNMMTERGLTVLVASHDPQVLDWADEVHLMEHGAFLDGIS